jgi:hypothetical protein
MKLGKRGSAVAVLGGLVAAAAVVVPSGQAQDAVPPGTTTLTFHAPIVGSSFQFVDNPPKSPVNNLLSPRHRFSLGDTLAGDNRLFDRRGGSRVGRAYYQGTVVRGRTIENLSYITTTTYVLNDGSQIVSQGYARLGARKATVPIVGGTGRFKGARGQVTTTIGVFFDSTTETLTLLP